MVDIVEQLREGCEFAPDYPFDPESYVCHRIECRAADEIERLRIEIARLREERRWLTSEERWAVEQAKAAYETNDDDEACERIARGLESLLARTPKGGEGE